jgi:hypothetical protein
MHEINGIDDLSPVSPRRVNVKRAMLYEMRHQLAVQGSVVRGAEAHLAHEIEKFSIDS